MAVRNDFDKEDMFQATFGKQPMTRRERRLAEKEKRKTNESTGKQHERGRRK